jgi:hypothetical protein
LVDDEAIAVVKVVSFEQLAAAAIDSHRESVEFQREFQ